MIYNKNISLEKLGKILLATDEFDSTVKVGEAIEVLRVLSTHPSYANLSEIIDGLDWASDKEGRYRLFLYREILTRHKFIAEREQTFFGRYTLEDKAREYFK
ncbi:MAG: hypothetical protein KKF48_05365 [Nanoarchaeota archaeon]|nr:hypothetical protein [Nanoarchaeota archaeon]MBU1028448.1 hypothetical protein [Nanoarchaeota archaeon]